MTDTMKCSECSRIAEPNQYFLPVGGLQPNPHEFVCTLKCAVARSKRKTAQAIIRTAEMALGPLSRGQRVDLLLDRMHLRNSAEARAIVNRIGS
jgi:hypothetical protein